jgi:hypothetical protein
MARLDDYIGPLLGSIGRGIGEKAQKKGAQFCYEVYRELTIQSMTPEWEDLTQREQNRWAAAFWAVLERKKANGTEG